MNGMRVAAFGGLFLLTACANTPFHHEEAPRSWADALGAYVTQDYAAPEFRAFDFWIGEWEANWRAPQPDAFEHETEGFRTHQRVFPVLGGKAIVELAWPLHDADKPGLRGFSIRYYDPARERWVMAQNWPSPGDSGLAFADQLLGAEYLGRISMYSVADRTGPDGKFASQHRRYNFADIRPGASFRWDGSNSADAGRNWFTWNVVDFLRQGETLPLGPAGSDLPGVDGKNLCTDTPHGAMNSLAGVWEGGGARLSAGLVLDGCGVLAALETSEGREVIAISYHAAFAKWVMYRLDDRAGEPHAYFVSGDAGEGAVFTEAPGLAIKDEFTPFLRADNFDVVSGRRRLVFSQLSHDALTLREDVRDDAHGEWRLLREFRLVRAGE